MTALILTAAIWPPASLATALALGHLINRNGGRR